MTDSQLEKINHIIANLIFSDNSSVKDRTSDIKISNGNVGFSIDITNIEITEAESLRKEAIERIKALESVVRVGVVLTSNKAPDKAKSFKGSSKIHVDGVGKIILVASGKGGVGKSTISALLAQKLANQNKNVGIIDADIYGPSIPHIFNLEGKPELEDKRMIPLQNHGVFVNSIAFLTKPSASISWRGPMVSKALYQLLSLTKWGELDYLIIDTPPGTGDIHLSLLQNYFIDKVLMVTTPQQVSELDVRRAIDLYKKFNIPIDGIIENMSYYLDSITDKEIKIFSGNSGAKIAKDHDVPLLTRIPIVSGLSADSDIGKSLKSYFTLIDGVLD